MFTGIIQNTGEVLKLEAGKLAIRSELFDEAFPIGSSIAVSGACLTVVEQESGVAHFELAKETLDKTSFSELKSGSKLNLEPALKMGDALDGHLVTGHVDCVSQLLVKTKIDENTTKLGFSLPENISSLVAPKGSITINGISLTVGEVEAGKFFVYIIPLTLEKTNLGLVGIGDSVNLEADLIARYTARILSERSS